MFNLNENVHHQRWKKGGGIKIFVAHTLWCYFLKVVLDLDMKNFMGRLVNVSLKSLIALSPAGTIGIMLNTVPNQLKIRKYGFVLNVSPSMINGNLLGLW